ncbi:enoyl reductase [Catenulispora sp. EB89]|uniref:NADP-dependent oxidoreductase n=1 Tax=Catenulispora sp. EB89 TaxID=3156257 RepID=UPI0035173232
MSSAIVFTEYGGPEVLRLVAAEPPAPAEGQVRVRVRAAGLQPADSLLRSGRFRAFMPARFPQRLGNELAGVVDAVGPGVAEFQIGQEVLGPAAAPGAHADHALADATQLVTKPSGLAWSEAGALSASGQTAATCLYDLGVEEGDTVLIHGAAGGVGSMAVQIAVAQGARVVGTASERNHQFLRDIGAVPVRYGPGLAERVREAVELAGVAGARVDAAFDTAGTDDALAASVELVTDVTRIGTVAAGADVERYGIRRMSTRRSAGQLRELVELAEAGKLRVFVQRAFGLEQAREAYKELDGGHVRGKLVFLMS